MNTKASEKTRRERESQRLELLKRALVYAWTDFHRDVRSSRAGDEYSIIMEWRVDWIRELSEVIGPVSWQQVEIGLLESGWFQKVHGELGYPVDDKAIDQWLAENRQKRANPT